MDSITQIVLGASVGEAVLGKKAGNRAALWGAIGGTIPDLDTIPGKFMETVERLEFHRGPSHSITFSLIAAPLIGWLIWKMYKKNKFGTWKEWSFLMFMALFTHPLLDCFTTWGTELFWPFSDQRISFKSIFVIDPLYTLPFMVCLVWLLFLKKTSRKRRILNTTGLTISSLYLALTLFNKAMMNKAFEKAFKEQDIPALRYSTRPTPLNNILWTGTAEVTDGFYTGYRSFFDADHSIRFYFIKKNHELLNEFGNTPKVEKLVSITAGYYALEKVDEKTVIFNDLRFGQGAGWLEGQGDYIFSFLIKKEDGSVRITQRENRFEAGWEMLKQLWGRIRGNY